MTPIAENLARLMKAQGYSQKSLAVAAGLNETAVRDILKGRSRNPTNSTVRRLADVLGISLDELASHQTGAAGGGSSYAMGYPHLAEPPAPPPLPPPLPGPNADLSLIHTSGLVGQRDLPIFASAMGGTGEMIVSFEPIEYVKRPGILEGVQGGFGFYMVGESMCPAYEPGDMVLCHPRKPAFRGDDVLLVLDDGNGGQYAMVKRLVTQDNDRLRVQQFNPAREFDLDRGQLSGVYVVVGSYKGRR